MARSFIVTLPIPDSAPKKYFLTSFPRLDHGQTHFQGRRAPAAIAKYRSAIDYCIIKLLDFGFTPDALTRHTRFSILDS
jgi:hypothetical protein